MLIFDTEKHPTKSFLDEFTSLCVQYAADDFVNSLRARVTDKPVIDTWSISQVVMNTLASLKTAPSEPSTAKLVQDVWSSLNGLLRYSEISAVCYAPFHLASQIPRRFHGELKTGIHETTHTRMVFTQHSPAQEIIGEHRRTF